MNKKFEIRTTDDIGEYLSAADVYVSVSSTESFGMANCEALLAGLPSVCAAVDAVPEVVGGGALLTSDNPVEISSSIKLLLTSEKERRKLIEKAGQITAKWPSPMDMATRMEEIYQNI